LIAAPGPPDDVRRESRSRLSAVWPLPKHVRRSIVVAAAAYAVVALFAVAYAIVDAGWGDLSTTTKVTIAALATAPLALGLLWSQLSGFKAFGFEVSLAQASATEAKVSGAITEQQSFSDPAEITKLVERIVDRKDVRALEIDLGDSDYWWPSRLYLVAALAADFSHVRAIAFVESGNERLFVGTAPPAAVRSALAAAFPSFEEAYAALKDGFAARPGPVRDKAAGMVQPFAGGQFTLAAVPTAEKDFPKVSPQLLQKWLRDVGADLDTRCVEWRGVSDPELVRALITEFDGDVVPLVRGLRLDRLVDRLDLARQLA
jgi:hypothetical protein